MAPWPRPAGVRKGHRHHHPVPGRWWANWCPANRSRSQSPTGWGYLARDLFKDLKSGTRKMDEIYNQIDKSHEKSWPDIIPGERRYMLPVPWPRASTLESPSKDCRVDLAKPPDANQGHQGQNHSNRCQEEAQVCHGKWRLRGFWTCHGEDVRLRLYQTLLLGPAGSGRHLDFLGSHNPLLIIIFTIKM